jgi:hypothetical protein
MSLQRKSYDVATLASDLLADVKEHCRVDFADDDSYLEKATARAIGLIERTTSFAIAPSTWAWTPAGPVPDPAGISTGPWGEGSNRCTCNLAGWQGAQGWQLPVCPASSFTAELTPSDGGAAVDVSASLEIAGVIDPSQFERQWLVLVAGGSIAPGQVTVTLNAGFADEATLPPGVADIVLRMTAYLYETREMAVLEGFDTINTRAVQAYAASLTTGLWAPSC